MCPRHLGEIAAQRVRPVRTGDTVLAATKAVAESGLPALPVVDGEDRYAGIFGEREFITALFPGYLGELRSVRFVSRKIDEWLETRTSCAAEPVEKYMTTERIDVQADYSDTQIAETFLHHRVLIVPILDEDQRVLGVITRSEFFRALARRFAEIA